MSRAVSRLGVRAELRWTLLKEYKCKEYVVFERGVREYQLRI